jgi:hypothetical protein
VAALDFRGGHWHFFDLFTGVWNEDSPEGKTA